MPVRCSSRWNDEAFRTAGLNSQSTLSGASRPAVCTLPAARLDRGEPADVADVSAALGRPLALYADKASLFRVKRPGNWEEQLGGQEPRPQTGQPGWALWSERRVHLSGLCKLRSGMLFGP